jgi:ABC-type glycerol-3-phosphate transport system substrate-binding protein
MKMGKFLATAAAVAVLATGAQADCAFENDVPVSISAAGFDAWNVVTAAMQECGNVSVELSQDFQEKQATGMAARPSLYTMGGVANSSMVPLLNAGLIRPLDDLVEQYGQGLSPQQLIRVDGQIMAIAMMVNAQHLMLRRDIFDDLGLDVPTDYDELIATAEAIREAGVVDYPFGAPWSTTWLIFVDMYLGYGGEFFTDGFMPAVNNETGLATLARMAELTEYMDPEYLVSDSTYVQQQLQNGRIAMANLWASRAGAMNNAEESQVVGLIEFASAPRSAAGTLPAATLWWDGVVIAANVSDEEAEAAFRVAMEGMDAEMANANPEAAIWIVPGFEPGEIAAGAAATAQNGARPYPASSHMGLMQQAIADNISAFLTGNVGPEDTLAQIEADYLTSAREAGIIE